MPDASQQAMGDELDRLLSIDQSLYELHALTVDGARADLQLALSWLQERDARYSDDQARTQLTILRAELNGELNAIATLPPDQPEDANQWPRQRRAIERAYSLVEQLGADIDRAAAQTKARADTLNGMLAKAGAALPSLPTVGIGLGAIIVILVLALVLLQRAKA